MMNNIVSNVISRKAKLTHFNSVQFIKEAAHRLEMGPIPTSTACMIYHRFYKKVSHDSYDTSTFATAAIYLAGKLEEQLLKLRDVINVCHRVLHPHKQPIDVDEVYWTLRQSVIDCELFIIRMLGFQLSFKHPHKYLLHYLKSLHDWLPPGIVANVPVARTSWTLLADCYHSDLCIRFRADHIAVAILYFCLLCHGVAVPCALESRIKWWEAVCEDISLETIREIITEIVNVYELENKSV